MDGGHQKRIFVTERHAQICVDLEKKYSETIFLPFPKIKRFEKS